MDLFGFIKNKKDSKEIPSEYRERVLQEIERLREMLNDFEADSRAEICALVVFKDGEGNRDGVGIVCAWDDAVGEFLLGMGTMAQKIAEGKKKVLCDDWLKNFVQRG